MTILDFLYEYLGLFLVIMLILDLLFLVIMLFMEKQDPKSFINWVAIIIIFPIIGFILYLFIGQTYYMRRVFSVKGINDELLMKQFEKEKQKIEGLMESSDDILREYGEFAQYLKNAGAMAFSTNNKMELFTDGTAKFDSFMEDLRNAKEYIFIEYYIIRNDNLGNEFMDLLTQKVKEGVEVRLLTDAFGNGKGPKMGIKKFREAGGKFAMFHKTITLLFSPKKNNRNHRKIAVIDGKVSYVGGYNIGDEYLGKGPFGYWRDTALRIEGAAHAICVVRMIADWNYCSHDKIEDTLKYLRRSEHVGNDAMQLVSGGPDIPYDNPVQFQYEGMMQYAQERLYIHTPYLAPNDAVMETLRTAALRGVDVRIIVPDKPDHPGVFWNTMSSANKLMKYGIRVYLYHNGFIHSKAIVADGKIGSVGSANLDDRSLRLNFETNVQVYSERICKELEEAFIKDLDYCEEYSCEKYDNKGLVNKIKTVLSSFFRDLA